MVHPWKTHSNICFFEQQQQNIQITACATINANYRIQRHLTKRVAILFFLYAYSWVLFECLFGNVLYYLCVCVLVPVSFITAIRCNAKEPYNTAKEPNITAKEPKITQKSHTLRSKSPILLPKSPTLLQNSPTLLQKSPIILPKSPILQQERPIILPNSCSADAVRIHNITIGCTEAIAVDNTAAK